MKRIVSMSLIIFFGLFCVSSGQSSLDLSSDTIPKGFKGDDIVQVVKALSKSAYDTTKIHSKRIDLSDKKDVDRLYFFKLSDNKVLSSSAGVWIEKSTKGIAPIYMGPEEVYYLIKDIGEKTKKWTGQNVFGARVHAETTTEIQYFVTPINGTNNIKKLAVKPEGSKIGVLFIGKPAQYNKGTEGSYVPEGYISYCGQSYAATFDMPYGTSRKFYSVRMELQEVWVYDQDSGKVLLKQKIEKLPAKEPVKNIRPRPGPPGPPPPLRPPTPRS